MTDEKKVRGPIAILPAVEGWRAVLTRHRGEPDAKGMVQVEIAVCAVDAWGIHAPTTYASPYSLFGRMFGHPGGDIRIEPVDGEGRWLNPDWELCEYVGPEEPDNDAVVARVKAAFEATSARWAKSAEAAGK